MQVFLGWSGDMSEKMAALLAKWLPDVIQQVTPFVSTEIGKGKSWNAELSENLGATNHGIICVTRNNQTNPWLNFEAGALAKSHDLAAVRPLLIDMPPEDLIGPLTSFQATRANDQEDVYKLVESINRHCAAPLDSEMLRRAFNRVWDAFRDELNLILASGEEGDAGPRPDSDKIAEILNRVRSLERDEEAVDRSNNTWHINNGISEDIVASIRGLDAKLDSVGRFIKEQTTGPVLLVGGEPLEDLIESITDDSPAHMKFLRTVRNALRPSGAKARVSLDHAYDVEVAIDRPLTPTALRGMETSAAALVVSFLVQYPNSEGDLVRQTFSP